MSKYELKFSDEILLLSSIDMLSYAGNVWMKSDKERAQMTLNCKDTDNLPKVKDAGKIKILNHEEVQIMHNGLKVLKNGYQGDWMSKIISELKGNHEPQEEKVFFEVMKRIDSGGIMMELGSWWAYYSMWFVKDTKGGVAICCEPDPDNLKLGKANATLNGFEEDKDIIFYNTAAGSEDGKVVEFQTEKAGIKVSVPIRTVDSIIKERKTDKLQILHLDIQGQELEALYGAIESIRGGKIRFIFVSTHHYAISNDAMMHYKCLDFIENNGGTIIAKHTILESSSGDGLIVASFDPRDKNFSVEISPQPTDDSLFRPAEIDTAVLWEAYNKLVQHVLSFKQLQPGSVSSEKTNGHAYEAKSNKL